MTETKRWTCDVCGYIHEGDAAPAQCPICGVGRDQFSETPVQIFTPKPPLGKWKCNVCGYVHEGTEAPEKCPVCSVPSEHFSAMDVPKLDNDSATSPVKVVIVGAGVAGLTAAETMAAAPNTEIILISREPLLPYYRLNLTRYLAAEVNADSLTMKSEEWFAQNNVTLVYGDVVSIDREQKQLVLKDNTPYSYDKLIIAAGAHCFVPSFPGVNREGVFTLRTKEDADAIIEAAESAKNCVVIGGGLLGLEAAGALKNRGCKVTVIEGYGWLLPRQLPPKAGALLIDILREKEIDVVPQGRTTELVGDESVRGVLLEDGTTIEADLVVISTGVRPNSYLARQCGLSVGNGILVDDQLCTNDPDVYAAGDVCEHRGVLYGIWPAGYIQGATAAANVLGAAQEFTGLARSNRLKVLDVDLFSIGLINPEDASSKVLEYHDNGDYRRLVVRDGAIKGAVLMGDTSFAGRIQEAIEKDTSLANWPDVKKYFLVDR